MIVTQPLHTVLYGTNYNPWTYNMYLFFVVKIFESMQLWKKSYQSSPQINLIVYVISHLCLQQEN